MMGKSAGDTWVGLLGGDPREWLLDGEEPSARFICLSQLMGIPEDDPAVRQARQAAVAHPAVRALIERLPGWGSAPVTGGHNSPTFTPNMLLLLFDMGLRAGDSPKVEGILDGMESHADADGRFQSPGKWRGSQAMAWGALFCDAHAITEALIRFGRQGHAAVRRGRARMGADLGGTSQGAGWLCRPEPVTGFRGPGRKGDCCPQVTLEALRAFSLLPVSERPAGVLEACRTALCVWRERGQAKPYMFGHGRQFKTVKWPPFWYDLHMFLDTLGRYPGLWQGRAARVEDRVSLAEAAACLVAYNFDPGGRVTPLSCYRGFEGHSFGQKKTPSRFATARLCAILRRFSPLAPEIAAVDVMSLPGSKGGTGTPQPPRAAALRRTAIT
jgi:hypothetical protein